MANTIKWCNVTHKATQVKVGLYTEPNADGKFRWMIPFDKTNPVKSDYVFNSAHDALHNAIESCEWNGFEHD